MIQIFYVKIYIKQTISYLLYIHKFYGNLPGHHLHHGRLENLFSRINQTGVEESICSFRKTFLAPVHAPHAEKRLSDPVRYDFALFGLGVFERF